MDRNLHDAVVEMFLAYGYVEYVTGTFYRIPANRKDGLYCIESRQLVLPVAFDHITPLDDRFYQLDNPEGVGLFDTQSKEILLQPEYNHLGRIDDGLFLVVKD